MSSTSRATSREISPGMIDALIRAVEEEGLQMATLCARITDPLEYESPHVVKIVRDANGLALYFSQGAPAFPAEEPSPSPSTSISGSTRFPAFPRVSWPCLRVSSKRRNRSNSSGPWKQATDQDPPRRVRGHRHRYRGGPGASPEDNGHMSPLQSDFTGLYFSNPVREKHFGGNQ